MGLFQRLFRGRSAENDVAWQTPIVQEIALAMLRQIPDDWDSAVLVLEVNERGLGGGLTHSAITPQQAQDFALPGSAFVTPNAEVLAATRKLELGWVERKGTFLRAIISAVRDESGWGIQSDYEHE